MQLAPNLSPPMRVLFGLGSIVLILIPFLAGMESWLRIALPVGGAMGLTTALTGW